jgi:hypothetical protein
MSIRARLLLIALLATAIPALLVLANFIKDREAAIAGDARRLAELAQAKAEDLHQRIRGTAQLQFGLARAGDLDTDDRAACSPFCPKCERPTRSTPASSRSAPMAACSATRCAAAANSTSTTATTSAALATRGDVVLEPTFGRLTGLAVMQVAYPARTPQGELRSCCWPRWISPRRRPNSAPVVPGAQLLVVDDKGQVLLAAPRMAGRLQAGGIDRRHAAVAFRRAGHGQCRRPPMSRCSTAARVQVGSAPTLRALPAPGCTCWPVRHATPSVARCECAATRETRRCSLPWPSACSWRYGC